MTFGERLASLRKEAGLTRTETALLTGCSREVYGSWESDRRTPSLRNIIGLSKALDVDYNKLIDDRYTSVVDIETQLEEIIVNLQREVDVLKGEIK